MDVVKRLAAPDLWEIVFIPARDNSQRLRRMD
jgi:hypothetical protein